MPTRELTQIGLVFERAAGSRKDNVGRMVRTVPALAGAAFRGCEVALEAASSTLLLDVHLDSAAADESIHRLRFWCARAGGWGVAPAVGSDLLRVAWRSRVGACNATRRCSTSAELAAALDELLGGAGSAPPAPDQPVLDIDVSGPGSAGIAFNPRERLLFVPGLLAPPLGDEFEVALRTAAAEVTARCWARVVRVRGVSQCPGAPAGFVLQLAVAPAPFVEALAGACASMNADALVEEARRAAPRFAVRMAVEIRLGSRAMRGSSPADAPSGAAAAGLAVSLSVGGAFVETAHPAPAGSSVLLRFRVADRERLSTLATVVYATSAGMGVKLHPDPREEAALCRMLARISARPRRVLVVDDDGLVRGMLGDALAALGYEILSASSGEEAVRVLASELYALDAVVTDLGMEGLDGSQLVQAVNSARDHVDIAIAVVSGRLDADVVERLAKAGADAALDKALRPERLAREVDALVTARIARPPGPSRSQARSA